MDWDRVIEKNREALKRILAALVAMAGLRAPTSPLVGEDGSARRGEAEALAEPGEGYLSGVHPTLPRHLHRAVLRLLRPAEAAARRLVIVAARDLVVEPPPARPPKPDPKAAHAVLRSLGIAVVLSPADFARAAAERRAAEKRAAARARVIRKIALPLLDPLRLPRPSRRRCVPPHAAPRILSFDGAPPRRLPPPPSPEDPIDSTRLTLRLAAVARALDDLPAHARRFARWRARRDAAGAQANEPRQRGRFRRISPLRPGGPPGLSAANRRRPSHAVHEVLLDMQYFAREALKPPDTS